MDSMEYSRVTEFKPARGARFRNDALSTLPGDHRNRILDRCNDYFFRPNTTDAPLKAGGKQPLWCTQPRTQWLCKRRRLQRAHAKMQQLAV